jgi:hypothetical protein
MATRRSPAQRRIGFFVEGTRALTPRDRDDLLELWRYQCSRVSSFPPAQLDVYGFSKQQIVIMDPAHAAMPGAGKIPLDVAIEQRFNARPFQDLVIAFDAYPANQAIRLDPREPCPCLRVEKDFVLRRFVASKILPPQFRVSAGRLLTRYQANRGQPRAPTRPPLGEVELIYMEPTFESLLLQDESALRRVFGLRRTPNTWPALPHTGDRPDFVLREIVNKHRKAGPNHLRLLYDAAKHAWAQEVLRNALQTSAIWEHAIADRLRKVLS